MRSMAYKDSLFRSIFGNRKSALALYNAVHGTTYDLADTEVVINTLGETLWTQRKNDLSFLVNRTLVVVAEHQSTINENQVAPVRLSPVRGGRNGQEGGVQENPGQAPAP